MSYNFDRVSNKYDESRGFPPGIAEQICDWVLARLPADPAVAEIGVGTGRIALPFIERFIRYTGFDISQQMTDLLREKLGGDLRRAQIYLADITQKLPVAAASQDAVIAVHILHLVDAPKALAQVRRILKPGGALLWGYNLHDSTSPRFRLRERVREAVQRQGGPSRRDFFAGDGRALLAQWGARHEEHEAVLWSRSESCREVLAAVREKLLSFTWNIPDDLLQQALAEAEAWAVVEYADLDRPHPVTERFMVDWFQF